jgi:hypothetical protein
MTIAGGRMVGSGSDVGRLCALQAEAMADVTRSTRGKARRLQGGIDRFHHTSHWRTRLNSGDARLGGLVYDGLQRAYSRVGSPGTAVRSQSARYPSTTADTSIQIMSPGSRRRSRGTPKVR